jgi:RNA polymerase sigma-70 factor, ECF subfamily
LVGLTYRGNVDSAAPQSAGLSNIVVSSRGDEPALGIDARQEPESQFSEVSGLSIDEVWRDAEAGCVDLTKAELARVLLSIGAKYNYGLASGVQATREQTGAFWRSLQLRELALAHACALGRDTAWRRFLARYREPLTQAAIGLSGSASLGHELADSLYSEIFGLTSRDGERRSPLASYAGRGSLMGFLRTTLAQRHVDHHRRTVRETNLDGKDFAAATPARVFPSEILARLGKALTATLRTLEAEERFLLSAWFLDQRTLNDIAGVLHVHEATVSRKIKRLTSRLHKELLENLRASGMSGHAAAETLGVDPRDLNINLRSLLQSSPPSTFPEQGGLPEPEQA